MGIIKWVAEEIAEDIIADVADTIVEGTTAAVSATVKAGKQAVKATVKTGKQAVKATVKAGKVTASTVSKTVSEVQNMRNFSALKKEGKKLGGTLLVDRKPGMAEGIYYITTPEGNELYNSLMDRKDNGSFINLRLTVKDQGEVASVVSHSVQKKGFLHSAPSNYAVFSRGDYLGHIFDAKEGRQKVYKTDFNSWFFTGEFSKGNYTVFDKNSGYTVATINKKFKKASAFSVTCHANNDLELILLISILIEITNQK